VLGAAGPDALPAVALAKLVLPTLLILPVLLELACSFPWQPNHSFATPLSLPYFDSDAVGEAAVVDAGDGSGQPYSAAIFVRSNIRPLALGVTLQGPHSSNLYVEILANSRQRPLMILCPLSFLDR
jgi:hypothetical protein